MKKIPYGMSNFKNIIEEDYYYIDKTMYLEKIEATGKSLAYFRPGRFGKSLFVSMMMEYYDVNSKNEFATLFKDTYVYEHPTKNKNNYYILRFDFSGINSSVRAEKSLIDDFVMKLIASLRKFNTDYHLNINVQKGLKPNEIIKNFLSEFNKLNLKNHIYVFIDESDSFSSAILINQKEFYPSYVYKSVFLKEFFECLKVYNNLGVVDRIFITGICPITLDAMTSGFNIATDISTDFRFNEMIGLTHEEVKGLIQDIDSANEEEIFKVMEENYDGYLFNEEATERVFNATLVMYFLREYLKYNKTIPNNLIDTNIIANYGKVKDLITLQDNEYYEDILNSTLTSETINGFLTNKYNLELKFTKDDIISLLYYFGYLTIDSKDALTGEYIFRIPNYVMKETYNNYFTSILNELKIDTNLTDSRSMFEELLKEGRIDKLNEAVSEILTQSDNRIFIKFDEKYVSLIYLTLLINNGNIRVYNEYSLNNGYADLMILRRSEIAKYDIMVELKYIKVSDYKKNRKIARLKLEEAINQVIEYKKDKRLDKKHLKSYVVVYVGNKVHEYVEVVN